MEYPTGPHDVYHVAFLLRQKLVADLVPIILDEAQYWTRRSVSTQKASTVTDAPEGKRLLRTEPLSAAEHRRVRMIRFTTRSVAQCFDRSIFDRPQSPSCGNCSGLSTPAEPSSSSSTPSIHSSSSSSVATTPSSPLSVPGTPSHEQQQQQQQQSPLSLIRDYFTIVNAKADKNKNEAFTWFEAHVGRDGAPDHLYPDTASRHQGATRAGAPRADGQLPDDGPRLISNCNTEEELTTYEAEWRFDSDDGLEKATVRGMRQGDVLDLTAHCSVFGWENFTKTATVEMFFGHVRR